MDFTLTQYTHLLTSLLQAKYSFLCFENYLNQAKNPNLPSVILRHDVDLLPQNSLQFAMIQHALGIRGSYTISGSSPSHITRASSSKSHPLVMR